MKLSDLNGQFDVVSQPDVSTSSNNNPHNIKLGGATQKYVDQGLAEVSGKAQDGGYFLKFKDPEAGKQASSDLLFNSGVYKGLTVDKALGKWSNNGYNGQKLVPGLANKSIDQLTDEERSLVMDAMQKAEGTVPLKAKTPTLADIGEYTVDTPSVPASSSAVPEQTALQGIGQAAKETLVDPFASRLGNIDYENQNFLSNGAQTVAAGIGGAYDVLGKGVGAAVDNTAQGIDKTFGTDLKGGIDRIKSAIGSTVSKGLTKTIDSLPPEKIQQLSSFIEKHPEAAKDIGSILTIFTEGKVGQLGAVKDALLKGAKPVAKLAKDTTIKTGEKVINNITKKADEKITNKIADTISPKPTIKEAKLAESEGRLIKGKERTFFRSGKADSVIPSDKTKNAIETIKEYIPDAHKMKETDLYTTLGKKVSEISTNLKPEMKAVPIKPATVKKVNTEWDKLKTIQEEAADTDIDKQVVKSYQKRFDDILKSVNSGKVSDIIDKARTGNMDVGTLKSEMQKRIAKIESASLDDLHEARIKYDDSIPDNVKNANQLSSDPLQHKRELWLQNRKILNDAIHDSETGLGETSQKAFKDMTNMYTAKQQILSKAKIETEGKLSKVRQFAKDHPLITYGGVGAAAGATGVPHAAFNKLIGH